MTVVIGLLLLGVGLFALGWSVGAMWAIRDEIEWLEAHAKECHAAQDR